MAMIIAPMAEAKGGRGGGGGGGGRSTPSKSAPASPKPSKPAPAPKPAPKTVESPKPIVSSTGKTMNGTGKVVDENFSPKFRGGYVAPAGSTVYYPDRGFMDYLPWIFLFTQDSHREVVVQQPDGKEETVREEGVDSMYIINWIVSILLVFGLIALVMWLINRKTNKYTYA